jgi:hypothetical protein
MTRGLNSIRRFVKSFFPEAHRVDPQKQERLENRVLLSCLMAVVVHEQCLRKTKPPSAPEGNRGVIQAPLNPGIIRVRPIDSQRSLNGPTLAYTAPVAGSTNPNRPLQRVASVNRN